MNREPINHLPLRDEVSGITALDARERRQRVRDNANWFEGLCDGLFWGIIFCGIVAGIIALCTR